MTTIGVFAAIFDGDRRILCVRRAYPPHNWTLPGGRAEPGESPTDALVREVREETGVVVEPRELIGVYAAPYKDDLVLFFECSIASRVDWHPDGEIAEVAFVAADALPRDLSPRTSARIADAFAGTRGAVRLFKDGSDTAQGGSSRGTASVVLLIPHTASQPRASWTGLDDDRPLNRVGVEQAEELAKQLGRVDAVYSSPARRCVQTIEPLAEASRLDIVLMDELREASLHIGPETTWDWMDEAMQRATHGAAVAGHVLGAIGRVEQAHPESRVAVCSHGDTIQIVVSHLAAHTGAVFPRAIDRGGWYEVSDRSVVARGPLLR